MATVRYGDHPGGEQEHGTRHAFGAPPSYPDQPGYAQPVSMPPTYRVWGIVALICAGLFNTILGFPTAYVGRKYSDSVLPLWAHGDVDAAVVASRKARAWLIASGVLDVLGIILIIVIFTHKPSSNFNNPSTVAASIKTVVQQRLSDSTGPYYAPGVTVTSVVCTPSGTDTDHCVIKLSSGDAITKTATISGHGTKWTTN